MFLAGKQIYRFEDVEVDCARGCLSRGGEERHLRQQAFQVLVYLLERRERLVSKNELFETVWNNMAVTDDVLVQCVTEIRRAIGDDSHKPRFIKTVPKSGYRFIGTVSEPPAAVGGHNGAGGSYTEEITRVEFEIEEETDTRIEPLPKDVRKLTPRLSGMRAISRFSAAAAVVLAGVLGTVFYFSFSSNSQTAEVRLPQIDGRKTIAVMFFENQSNTAELEWLREGLADMLITNLSRSEKLTVLSRGHLHLLLERTGYRMGGTINLEKALEVSRKSGAEIMVMGSFARLGEKVRVEAQIYDLPGGSLATAESLTVEKPEQILTEIDLLSFRLLNRFGSGEQANQANLAAAMTNNLDAYRNYSLALEKAQGLHKIETLALLEKAIALDPEFAMAHARIGHTYAITWGWAEKAKPHLTRAFELSGRLTEKDRLYILAWYAIANLDYPAAIPPLREIIARYPSETEAYLRLGYLFRGEEQFEEAIAVMRQGLAIDPESSALYNALGLLYSLLGRHDDAIAMHERYVALAPSEANARDSLGMSLQWAGRYDEAIAEYRRALDLDSGFEIAHAHLGTAHFQTGRYAAAIVWFKKYIAVAPSALEISRGYSHLAHVYRRQKNGAQADRAAKRAIENNKNNAGEMIVIATERGDRKTARKFEEPLFAESTFTNRGSRGSPRNRFYYGGYIALKDGQTDTAVENFSTALRHSPATWDIDPFEDCLANAYLEIGQFDEAIAEYRRILRLNPNYPLTHFHLARAFEAKAATEEARASFQKFLEIWANADKDIPEIVAARKFLGL